MSGAPQREADREHQERRHFVDGHRLEGGIAIAQALDRIRGFDRDLEPLAEDFGKG